MQHLLSTAHDTTPMDILLPKAAVSDLFQHVMWNCAGGQDGAAMLLLLPNGQPPGGAAAALQAVTGALLGALLQAHGSGLDGATLAEQLSQA